MMNPTLVYAFTCFIAFAFYLFPGFGSEWFGRAAQFFSSFAYKA